MPKVRWKTIRSKVIHKNPWYQILKDEVIRPDGNKGQYFVVKTKADSVFIVALNHRKEIVFVKIHRYPTQQISIEVPAGNSDGQRLLSAAKRELLEETGYTARRWKKAGEWQPMNGVCREMSHVFIAQGLKKVSSQYDLHEGICEVQFISYRKAFQMAAQGKITDGQSIVSLYLAGHHMGWIKIK